MRQILHINQLPGSIHMLKGRSGLSLELATPNDIMQAMSLLLSRHHTHTGGGPDMHEKGIYVFFCYVRGCTLLQVVQ